MADQDQIPRMLAFGRDNCEDVLASRLGNEGAKEVVTKAQLLRL